MTNNKIKDRMIKLMAEFISKTNACPYDKFDIEPGDCDEDCDKNNGVCWGCSSEKELMCWIKYFEQKASGVKFVGIINDEKFWEGK